ncbi:flavin-containing monooxygenase [Corynebacterium sp. NPDC060344]|uniref:flavin-containing monooxygenase n=1 Tax=Corynebacterium sp. NPDC060344 TaxID=3347101 RepID=UPI0036532D33
MDILIIGAGPSGLATAAELRRAGLDYDHVERHDGVGGLWDIDNPTTPMYESAHFISSKRLSCLPGRPFADDVADYPPRTEILRYLREFADDEGIAERIEFGTEVVGVEPAGESGYLVEMRGAGSEPRTKRYDHVICASGTLSVPNLPDIPGDFDGEFRHSATYRGIDELRGKRVLVIGAGNSGCDIACDAAQAAESAELSMRRGYWFIPKHIFGRPSDEWTVTGPQLPARIMQAGAQAILRLYFGDLRKLGLPKPDHRIFETHPLLNDQLIHHLRHGDISVRGDVSLFDGPDVVFADGSRGSYDLVLACTGFDHAVPYAADLFGGDGGNAMEQLYLGCAHRTRPGLWAPGLIETNSGAFGAIGQQARLIAAVLADDDKAADFDRRRRDNDVDLTGGLTMDRSERHRGYVDSHALHAALAGELEALGLDARRDQLGGLAG